MLNILSTVLTILANGLIAILLYKNNRRSATNILLVLLSIDIILWTLFTHLALAPGGEAQRLFFVRLVMFSTAPFGPIIYLLSLVFPDNKLEIDPKKFAGILILTVLAAAFAITPWTFTELINAPDGKFIIIPGLGIIPYALAFIGGMSLGFNTLIRKHLKAYGTRKIQLGFFLYGLIISCILLTITNFLLVVLFGSIDYARLGPPSTLIVVSLLAYAIIKHKLFDVRALIVRSLGYTISLGVLLLVYSLGLIFVQSSVFNSEVTVRELFIAISLTIIIGLSFNPLQNLFSALTKKVFFRDSYNSDKLVHQLTLIMASTFHIEELTRKLLIELLKTIKVTQGMIILIEKSQVYWVSHQGYEKVPEINEDDMNHLTHLKEDIILYEEVSDQKTRKIFQKYSFQLVSPIINDGHVVGLLALGDKLSGDMYNTEDETVLSIFSAEVAVAIDNAKANEEIRRFNITLKEEVESATKELVTANNKLLELDKLKDEFVSIASHELRTPMVSIKNYVWMTLAGKGGKVSQKQKFYLQRAYDSANRMTKLINDMLNISRIESGRIMLNVEKVDLVSLVESIVDELRPRAKQLEINLELTSKATATGSEKEVDVPPVAVDKDKVAEVLVNLLGNALKFTPKDGTIRTSLELDESKKQVVVHVQDTGVGLTEEQMAKLFKKFGMVKETYRSQSDAAQGTGLGLYISKSIIELHGGKIWVESEGKNKGCRFSFTVPIYSDSVLEKFKSKFDSSDDAGIIRSTVIAPDDTSSESAANTEVPADVLVQQNNSQQSKIN